MTTRNPEEDTEDKQERVSKQKEGDIFLKHNEDPKSTAVIIRNNQIVAHTREGKIGIKIQENGTIFMQGAIDVIADSKNISRYTYPQDGCQVTENPQSTSSRTMFGGTKVTDVNGYPPHVHTIQPHDHELVPPYLRKMTDLSMIEEVKDLLLKFIEALGA